MLTRIAVRRFASDSFRKIIREDARSLRASGKRIAERLVGVKDQVLDAMTPAEVKQQVDPLKYPKNDKEWAALIEQRIQDAMSRGEFSDLPGKGKPIEHRPELDDAYVFNDEDKFAHKILRNHGFAPPWIEQDRSIRQDLELLDRRVCLVIVSGIEYLHRHMSGPDRDALMRKRVFTEDEIVSFGEQLQSSDFGLFHRVMGEIDEQTVHVNRKIDDFNLVAPVLTAHKWRRNRGRTLKAVAKQLAGKPLAQYMAEHHPDHNRRSSSAHPLHHHQHDRHH
jgi:hypothetical protein